jgi:hypothetical protein
VPGLVALIKDVDQQTGGKFKKSALSRGPGGRITLGNREALGNPLASLRYDARQALRKIDPAAADKVNE